MYPSTTAAVDRLAAAAVVLVSGFAGVGWTPEHVQELPGAKLTMAPDLKKYQL